ncbi:MAG: hypothetical protein H0T92_11720 [Pyrinomonadaceae bacterium]|nr:hypothetical protein [Pyrinomonadaceae bacterium]
MNEQSAKVRLVHENLDTSYVRLAALLRWLQQRSFVGRIHVELDDYTADIFLGADEAPRVHERDRATGREAEGEAALHRLLVRARSPGGSISVYQGSEEAAIENRNERHEPASFFGIYSSHELSTASEEADYPDVVQLTGELIQAVEQGITSADADFTNAFHVARLSLTGDYPFLDPSENRFSYATGTARVSTQIRADNLVLGVSEALRHAVDRAVASSSDGGASVRRAVARELTALAERRREDPAILKWTPHLERIAGNGMT